MAEKESKESSEDTLVRKFTEGMTAAIVAAQPKKVTFGEYIRRQPKLPKLKRRVLQNDYPGQNLSATEISLANRLTHDGTYMDQKVHVVINKQFGEETVNLIYPNKTPDMRFEMTKYFRGFEDLVRQLVEVQEAEDKEAALMASPRR